MADLTVDYAGLRLSNPIITASSSLGNNIDKLKRLEDAGAAAVTTKLTSSAQQPPEHQFPYRIAHRPAGWMVVGEQNLSLEYGVRLVELAKAELEIPVIANFIGIEASPEAWVHDALALQDAGADAVEMDLAAPMAGKGTHVAAFPDGGHGALNICAFPEQLTEVVRELIAALDIPVIPKMNPNVTSMTSVARALITGGAKTIVMSNILWGNPGIDVFAGGQSKIPLARKVAGVPLMGPYLFPIHSRSLLMLRTTFGDSVEWGTGGGVYSWEELAQRIMLGAKTVQLCSAIYEHGPAVIRQNLSSLEAFMTDGGYGSLDELRGIAPPEPIASRAETSIEPAVARIKDREALIGRSEAIVQKVQGDCLAMSMGSDGAPVIDENFCTGCGWCVHHAGDGSIELVKSDRFVSDLEVPRLDQSARLHGPAA